jgi:hypothetical protein
MQVLAGGEHGCCQAGERNNHPHLTQHVHQTPSKIECRR